jgi:uncharacterized membrane protein YkvA (DUF1232 family)
VRIETVAVILAAIVGAWLLIAAVLYFTRPDDSSLTDAARLVPDTFRMVRKLATDRTIPLATRIPVWLLLVYLASPIDVIPDFVPVIGYADDAIITSLVLRRFIRKAGAGKLREHWPGSDEGLDRLRRLLRVTDST